MIEIPDITASRAQISKPSSVSSLLNREINLFGSQWSDHKKERFYNELHILLTAGLDIRTSFELLAAEAEKKADLEMFTLILHKIVAGSTLPEAIKSTGKFSDYEFYSLRIGEEAGTMNTILNDLSMYYQKKIKQKRKVTSALSYPLIVVGVAICAVIFMLRFVVPMFADMLSRFGTELPGLTKWIISASDFIGNYGPWTVVLLLVSTVTLFTQRKQSWFRKYSTALVLKLPFVGKITQKIYVERFAHAMHLLLLSKTNLIDALMLVRDMIGFYPIESSMKQVHAEILAGTSLHACLAKFPVYPKRMVSLIRVAEESNQLDTMFLKISRQLSDEIEHETSLISSIIEPMMILLLGVMVAVILVAMYLPMFKLGTAFG